MKYFLLETELQTNDVLFINLIINILLFVQKTCYAAMKVAAHSFFTQVMLPSDG